MPPEVRHEAMCHMAVVDLPAATQTSGIADGKGHACQRRNLPVHCIKRTRDSTRRLPSLSLARRVNIRLDFCAWPELQNDGLAGGRVTSMESSLPGSTLRMHCARSSPFLIAFEPFALVGSSGSRARSCSKYTTDSL
jgi:hypothetical protein